MKLLIVEDENILAEALIDGLEEETDFIKHLTDGEMAAKEIIKHSYDVVVLDVGLPKKDGFEVLEEVRAKGNSTPILMLTARDSIEDKVKGLEHGADDYLTKPFEFEELCARIKALHRRFGLEDIVKFSTYTYNPKTRTVTEHGKVINVSKRELEILECLLKNAGKVVTKTELLNYETDTNVLEVHMHNLRKKIKARNLIQTIRGVGYFIQKDRIKK